MKIRKGYEKEYKALVEANKDNIGHTIIDFVEHVANECEKDLKNLTASKFLKIEKSQPEYETFSGSAYAMAELTLYGYWDGSWKLKEIFPEEYRKFERNNPEFRWPTQNIK